MCCIVIGLVLALLLLVLAAAAMDANSSNQEKTKDELEKESRDVTSSTGCMCVLTVIFTGALILIGLLWLIAVFSNGEPQCNLPWAPK